MTENIFEKIREEHKEFKDMLKTIANGNKGKEDAFEELKKELEAHNKAEERTLYEGMLQEKKSREMALVGIEEHRMGTGVVNKLDRSTSKWDEEWKVQVQLLKHLLEKHIEVEENEVIPMAEGLFNKKAVEELSENFESIEEKIEQGG